MTLLNHELVSRAKLCLVSVFPDIVKDCRKMRNLPKIFLRSFENVGPDVRTYCVGCGSSLQDVTRKVLLSSLHKDPHTTWVKGPSGKHTNVSALLDWPDEDDSDDDDPDSEPLSSPRNSIATTTSDSLHGDSQSRADNADGGPPSVANDDNPPASSVSK